MSKDKTSYFKLILVILVVIIFTGVICGVLFSKKLTKEQTDMLLDTLINSGSISALDTFKKSLFNNLLFFSIVTLGAASVFLIPIIPCALLYKSYSFGFSAGFFIHTYGLSGFFVSALLVLPQAIICTSALLIFSCTSINRAIFCYINRRDYDMKKSFTKKFVMCGFLTLLVLIISSLFECALSGVWRGLL